MFNHISGTVSSFETDSGIFFDSHSTSTNPFFAVKAVFDNHNFVSTCRQNDVFIGPCGCIAGDFKRGSNLVDFVNNNGFFSHIARFIGDTEKVSAVFSCCDSIAFGPFGTTEILDDTFIGGSNQDNVFVGPFSCIAGDFQRGSDFVDFVNDNGFFCDVARLIGNTETVSAVGGGSDAVAFDPSRAIEIFDGSVTGTCCQDHILIGPAFCVSGNAQFRSGFVDIINNELTCTFVAGSIFSTEINDSVVCNTELPGVIQPSPLFSDAVLFDRTVFAVKDGDCHILIGP